MIKIGFAEENVEDAIINTMYDDILMQVFAATYRTGCARLILARVCKRWNNLIVRTKTQDKYTWFSEFERDHTPKHCRKWNAIADAVEPNFRGKSMKRLAREAFQVSQKVLFRESPYPEVLLWLRQELPSNVRIYVYISTPQDIHYVYNTASKYYQIPICDYTILGKPTCENLSWKRHVQLHVEQVDGIYALECMFRHHIAFDHVYCYKYDTCNCAGKGCTIRSYVRDIYPETYTKLVAIGCV